MNINATAIRRRQMVVITGLDHWPLEINVYQLDRLIPQLIQARRELSRGGGIYGFRTPRPREIGSPSRD